MKIPLLISALVGVFALAVGFNAQAPPAPVPAPPQGPPLLTFNELVRLYRQDVPPPGLQAKLATLLTQPFVSNRAADDGAVPLKPLDDDGRKILRVAQWNIERGLEFDAVRLAFTDPRGFTALMRARGSTLDASHLARARQQVLELRQADVICLNEVDWGVNRTLFRNVAGELAQALHMNYAYGVEFVEVDPITMGLDQQTAVQEVLDTYSRPGDGKAEMIAHVHQVMRPDPARYLGLHGNAILSRYRLRRVRLIPYRFQGYDWYADEKKKLGDLGKAEGAASMAVVKEQMIRQVRRGGRTMLLADIEDPTFPTGAITLVDTHLEDMTPPASRRRQLAELLDQIRSLCHPVIVAGDMNTNGHDAAPITLDRELKQRFGSGKWWEDEGIGDALSYGTPFGWLDQATFHAFDSTRRIHDPTVRSIRWVGENPEARFFEMLRKFRFQDGAAFDFRGVPGHTSNGRTGTLADSNQRAEKGFEPTNELARTFGPEGVFKIDWIFVRPPHLTNPTRPGQSFAFAPEDGRTLQILNHALPDRISDHNPILTDIPISY